MQSNIYALFSLELPLHFVVVAVEREMAVDAQDLRQYGRVNAHLDIFRCDFLIFFANFIEFASFDYVEKAKFFKSDGLTTNNIRQRIAREKVNS